MAMVSVVYWQHKVRSAWSKRRQPTDAVVHSLHELVELSQCFKHDNSSINITHNNIVINVINHSMISNLLWTVM